MNPPGKQCGLFLSLVVVVLSVLSARPAVAQAPWPDLRYQYRIPLNLTNSTNHAFAAGEIVTATVPRGTLRGWVREDAADLALVRNGAALPMKGLLMGGSVKVIFALPEPLPSQSAQSGYDLYFGGPSVSTPPPAPEGVSVFDFSDGGLHGWKSLQDPATTGATSSDVHIGADPGGKTSLVLTTWQYHHPVAFASTMVPLADATTYTELRTGGGENEAAALQRFTTQTLTDNYQDPYLTGGDLPGAGLAIDSYGSQMMALYVPLGNPEDAAGRRHPGPGALDPGMSYVADPGKTQFLVSATQDASAGSGLTGTGILGKAWQGAPPYPDSQGDLTPGGFKLSRRYAANGSDPLPAGVAGLMAYSTTLYLHWMVVVPNGYADTLATTTGARQSAPDPGPDQAVVQGAVYDRYRGAGYTFPNATVRLSAGETVLATTVADSAGHYRVVLPAGANPVTLTVRAEAGDLAGEVSQDVTGGATYSVDVPVAYTGRVSGVVTDRNGQPVAGAAVGRFLDGGPYVLTGADGRFEVPVPKGTAVVGAHKDGMLLSGPRWLDASSGAATADFTLFPAGPHTLQGLSPQISGATGGTDPAALTDGDLSTAWTSGPVAAISPQNPLRLDFILDDATVSEVDVHWKHHPSAWRVELTNLVTNDYGYSPTPQARAYYSAGETNPPENGGYIADGTQDRHVVAVKMAPVTGVKKLSIVITGVADGEPLSLYEVVARAPQPVTVEDAAIAMRIASGLREPPTDPNAFERWNAENENRIINMRDAMELLRDMGREVKRLRVFAINYEPVIESRGGVKVRELYDWRDPHANTEAHRKDLELASNNYLRIYLQPQADLDEWPLFMDGTRYTDEEYLADTASHSWNRGSGDYNAIIRQFDLARRASVGDIDEVWLQGVPGFGWWETTLAGPNGYWCNSGPVPGENGTRLFCITGFNYERANDVMLEDWGHRTESILGWKVHHGWNASGGSTHWDHFTRYEKIAPGRASAGNVHYPPNGTSDYDFANTSYVYTDADDWFNFPSFTGKKTRINREAWKGPFSGDYHRNYHIWWFQRIPHIPGTTVDPGINEARQMNWWKYIVDYNAYPESR